MRPCKVLHKVMTVKDLEKQKLPLVIHNKLEQTQPHKVGNYDIIGVRNIQERMIVTRLSTMGYKGNDEGFYVYYLNPNGVETYLCMHHSQEVCLLTGSTKKKILDEVVSKRFKNLRQNLAYGGSLGSDPEIFVEDGKTKEIIPAFNFLDSKKDSKDTVTYQAITSKIYWDGFQAEFETAPFACLSYHATSVNYMLQKLLEVARKKYPDAELSAKPVVMIDADTLATAKEEHVTLGCMPSYNVYGMQGDKTTESRLLPIRSAGGHIHFGIGKRTEAQVKDMVKALDAILGVACVSLFQNIDNPIRRKFYGMAGEYRLPEHGLEYRTLSNAWMYHPFIMNIVFDLSRKALVFGQNGFLPYWKATEAEVIKCINECDVKLAQEILNRNKETFITLYKACYGDCAESLENLFQIYINGMESAVEDPTNISKNWKLTREVVDNHGWGNFTHNRNSVLSKKKVA